MITMSGDVTHQIQDAVSAGNSPISLGPGTATLNATVLVNNNCKIVGCGPNASILVPQPGMNAFDIRVPGEDYSTVFEDFSVRYPQPQGSGTSAAFKVGATGTQHTGFRLRRFIIVNPQMGIVTTNASRFVIDDLECRQVASIGVQVQNTYDADFGDSTIVNSTFWNWDEPIPSAIGVQMISSGGLRICNTKINQFGEAVELALANGAVTSDLLIVGCSMEAYGGWTQGIEGAAIVCYRQGTGSFQNLVVAGSQIGGFKKQIDILNNSPAWLTHVSVGGNNAFSPQ